MRQLVAKYKFLTGDCLCRTKASEKRKHPAYSHGDKLDLSRFPASDDAGDAATMEFKMLSQEVRKLNTELFEIYNNISIKDKIYRT